MSKERVINLEPQYTDVIKLEPIDHVIELNQGDVGMYIEMRKIIVPDFAENCHIKNLSGIYISQYDVTGIRARVHYPHFPGTAWDFGLNDNEYILSEIDFNVPPNTNGYKFSSLGALSFPYPLSGTSYVYGQKWGIEPKRPYMTGGNWSVLSRYSPSNQNFYRSSVVTSIREDVFMGYRDGFKAIEENGQYSYHPMYYNFKEPYCPEIGDENYYKDPLVADVSNWFNGVINTTNKTWSINNFQMNKYRMDKLYVGNYSDCFQNAQDNNYSDPRLQFIEIQLLAGEKIATRIYFIGHIPQAIPPKAVVPIFLHAFEGKIELINNDPPYPSYPDYRIEKDELQIGLREGDCNFEKTIYPNYKENYGNKLPIHFPLTGAYYEEEIEETVSGITGFLALRTYALENEIILIDNENDEWEYTEDEPNGKQYTCDFNLYKPDSDDLYTNLLILGNASESKSFTITYKTKYIPLTELKSVKSCRGNGGSTTGVLPNARFINLFYDITEYDIEEMRGFSKYCLECEEWAVKKSKTSTYENPLLFWVELDITNSDYFCGSNWKTWGRLMPHTYDERNCIYKKSVHDLEAYYSWTYPVYSWLIYPTIYWYKEESPLYDLFPFGRSGSSVENMLIYGDNIDEVSITTPEEPISIPEDPIGNFSFREREMILHNLVGGIHGRSNDGGRSDVFITFIVADAGKHDLYDPYSESNLEGYKEFAVLGLPLNSIYNFNVYSFNQPLDVKTPARWDIYPQNENENMINMVSLIHGYSITNKPIDNQGISKYETIIPWEIVTE